MSSTVMQNREGTKRLHSMIFLKLIAALELYCIVLNEPFLFTECYSLLQSLLSLHMLLQLANQTPAPERESCCS